MSDTLVRLLRERVLLLEEQNRYLHSHIEELRDAIRALMDPAPGNPPALPAAETVKFPDKYPADRYPGTEKQPQNGGVCRNSLHHRSAGLR